VITFAEIRNVVAPAVGSLEYTAARFHVQNLVSNSASSIEQGLVDTEPTDEWRGREAYTDDFFPLQSTSSLRRGEFSALVARANLRGLISADTASVYLEATSDQYIRRAELIADLFSFDA
jgi:hypothetical protein